MKEFFAGLYEWWGGTPLFSTALGDHLRGYDVTCSGYFGTPWYTIIGASMILITLGCYALQYHVIDSTHYNKKGHWWLTLAIIVTLNFLVAFLVTNNALQSGDYCKQLSFNTSDCLGFGLSNALWSLVLFILVSSPPLIRQMSINCRYTTFWKP